MRKRRAFTLVELLVVLAVIAILMALLIPALGGIRKRGRTVLCIANQRGLVNLWQNHLDLQRQLLRPGGHSLPYGAWDFQLLGGTVAIPRAGVTPIDAYYAVSGQVDERAKLRWCPEAPYAVVTRTGSAAARIAGTATSQWFCDGSLEPRDPGGPPPSAALAKGSGGSYGYNAWLYAAPGSSIDVSPFKSWEADVVMPVFADSVSHDIRARATDTPTTVINPAESVFMGSLNAACLDRHGKAVNVGFSDLHVETVKLPDLWRLKWSRSWTRTTPQKVPSK